MHRVIGFLVSLVMITAALASDFKTIIESYGFEMRNSERPYGVPFKGKLQTIKADGVTYQFDGSKPLNEEQIQADALGYLKLYAAKDIELQSRLFGEGITKPKIDFSQVLVMEEDNSLIKPPERAYSARLPKIKHQSKSYDVFCNFYYLQHKGHYYRLYKKTPYSGVDRMIFRDPACDVTKGY